MPSSCSPPVTLRFGVPPWWAGFLTLLSAVRRLARRVGRLLARLQERLGPDDCVYVAEGARRALPIRARELLLVSVFMFGVTCLMTWPQAVRLDAVPNLGDPLFSTWRMSWVAHQLPRDPLHLFDANIFHPERRTLAYSDAILLPAVAAAPFLWLGALWSLSTICCCSRRSCSLAWRCTCSRVR